MLRTREDARIYRRLSAYDFKDGIGDLIAEMDEEDDWDDEPDVDECGFDPYEGCYTYDC